MKAFFTALIMLINAAHALGAFQDSLPPDTTILLNEEVVVTALRMEVNGDGIAEAVVVQNQDERIRLAPMSTPDAMAAMAGVWMQKTNHGGGSPFIRGLTGYHTLLLLDGIRFNNSTFRSGPNQYLNTVDVFTLARIEVLRGEGSVQYGSDGIGGVAQLFFRDPEFSDPHKAIATGRLYTNYVNQEMEYTGRAEVELATSNVAFLGGFTYKQLGDIRAGGALGTLSNTGFDEQSWDIKGKTSIGTMLLTGGWQHVVQNDVPLYHQLQRGNYSRYHFNPQQRDLGYVRLESFRDSKIFSRIRYTVAYLNSLEEREKQKTGSSVMRYEQDEVDTYHAGVEVLSDFSTRWKGSSGIEIYHDRIASSASDVNQDTQEVLAARGLYPDGSIYWNAAIFSLHTMSINRFTISLGARYNLVQLNVDDPVFGKTAITPQSTVGNAGVVFNASKAVDLIASANTGFRAPNLNDVASFGVADYRYEVPNYSLGSEKSFQYQTGIRIHKQKFRAEIFAYQNHLKDLISNVASTYYGEDSLDGFRVYQKENINEALITGLEGGFEFRPVHWFSAFGNMTYTMGDNSTKDEPLSRIPPLFGRIGLDSKVKQVFTWRLELLVAGKQDRLSSGDKSDPRIADGGTPGWLVLNTRLHYVHRNFRVNAGVQNIFNTAYRIHGSGVDGVGRSFWLSMIFEISSRQ